MDLRFLLDILNGVKRELFNHRFLAVFLFMAVTASVMAVGYVTPKTYTSNAMLHADQSNILQPLLRGQAEMTNVERINSARELLQSRQLLERVAARSGLLTGAESEEQRNGIISRLRNSISMRVTNRNFLNVSYTSDNPTQSFRVLSALIDEFIEQTAQQKRSESRNAFEFIESQVQSYKRQLEAAENALKEFRAANRDGTEANVNNRIQNLRGNIEDLELRIEESEARVELTRRQLENEQPYREVPVSRGATETDRRIESMRQQLDNLRLTYQDSHPDIVSLRNQIEELEQQRLVERELASASPEVETIENPVYEDLRMRLNEAITTLETQRNRLASTRRLLQEEHARAERIAANQAEETELMRDYDVTRGVYEDMLQRRENARLSMTLDVEGQGINYRIQEPATYPTRWDGLQLHHFGAAGPVIGAGLVVGLMGALVLFDNKIRSDRMLRQQLPEGIRLLAAVPHYNSSLKARILRLDVIALGLLLGLFMAGYGALLLFSVMGVDPETLLERILNQLPFGGTRDTLA